MRHHHFSIRALLLIVIGILNILIAAPLGYFTWKSLVNYREAVAIRHDTETFHHFYLAKRNLSQERAAALSILYVPADSAEALKREIVESREEIRKELQKSLDELGRGEYPAISAMLNDIRISYADLQAFQIQFDKEISRSGPDRDSELPDIYFEKTTGLIDKIDSLISIYSREILSFNPLVTRQMRITRLIWEISEYAGREYAILGKLIAQNKFPEPETRDELITLRNRIQYGMEITHGAIETGSWRQELEPVLNEAETHYSMVFEQIKDVFYQPGGNSLSTIYPVTVEMWLQIASEAVGSIYDMTDAILQMNILHVQKMEGRALQSIYLSLILFISALTLSLYTWRLVTHRVINPVNTMAEALYSESKLSMTNIQGDNGLDEITKLEQALAVFRENSRQLQEERDKARAASIAKSEFLANMSHEIRTPMNVVVGISSILAKTEPLTAKQLEFIQTLKISADSLLTLINDLLDFSKIESRHFTLENTRFNLDKLVDDLVQVKKFKARERNLKFNYYAEDISGKEYIGDPTRIRQILVNLCGNAIKFTEKGSITLTVSSSPHAIAGFETINITVKDTGIGIPADKQDSIFDKFTQADSSIVRKYGGTGLGLAITKQLIDMMDGSIEMESSPQGTVFYVSIPLKFRARKNSFTQETAEQPAPKKDGKAIKKVLLVEDYQPNILVAGSFLSELGFLYDTAENGREAVHKFMENDYDAILMDVQMPEMDGYEATRIIRDYERNSGQDRTKIIGFTAHASAQDKEKCMAVGMDDYLPKPFEQKQLEKLLQE